MRWATSADWTKMLGAAVYLNQTKNMIMFTQVAPARFTNVFRRHRDRGLELSFDTRVTLR